MSRTEGPALPPISERVASPVVLRYSVAAPVASASPACTGSTFTLSATNVPAGASYQWSGPNGFNSVAAAPTVPARLS